MLKANKYLLGFGISLLFLALCWGIFNWWAFRLYDKVSPAIESFADEFYARYNNQEYSYIYNNLTAEEFRNTYGSDDFIYLLREVCQGVGRYKEREMYSWRIRRQGGKIYFYIEYDVTYEKGTTNENFLLKKINDSWLIASYEFE